MNPATGTDPVDVRAGRITTLCLPEVAQPRFMTIWLRDRTDAAPGVAARS